MQTSAPHTSNTTDVVIVGAGPTGLTLACDLARRGVPFRILEKTAEPFQGSRAKGIQPRTLEIFDALGVAPQLLQAGAPYPPMRLHLWFFRWTWNMIKPQQKTPDVPYPNTWLVPQWRTEEVLRNRLAELGHHVEYGTEISDIVQDGAGVTVQINRNGVTTTMGARYLVGADGGRSFVRKHLGVPFMGTTSQEGRMIVGDLRVDGLSRDCWHVWRSRTGGMVGLCPLPHTDLFQLMLQIDPSDTEPELTEQAIQTRWLAATGLKNIRLHSPKWLSVFRPNVRLVERYRTGRIFLAGDAAHVHTPAGAQGLNTGIQDSWNLGWKLALVLGGAPDALLDTYEEERMPVAAGVLKLSTELFKAVAHSGGITQMKRGDEERQLLLNYRGRSLAVNANTSRGGKVQAGDRAPDAPCTRQSSEGTSLFDAFRGGHFTVLAFGPQAIDDMATWPRHKQHLVRVVPVRTTPRPHDTETLTDNSGHAHRAYGVSADENITFLVRPDGYVAHVVTSGWQQAIASYVDRVCGHATRQTAST